MKRRAFFKFLAASPLAVVAPLVTAETVSVVKGMQVSDGTINITADKVHLENVSVHTGYQRSGGYAIKVESPK